jgi:hypothetical protein
MYSATHFEREQGMSMTELAELLSTGISDTIFTVQFRKQTTPEQVEERLKASSLADIKKPGFAKGLVEGKPCTMICHLLKAENNLGRSLVVDLTAEGDNKIR